MGLTLGWYYHLPPCASADEVAATVDDSLQLLLQAHRERGAPVALAITGSLLERIAESRPACLALLRAAVEDGHVQSLACTFYEVCPFLVPPRYLRMQIERDLACKERLLGLRPTAFWPGNLAWAPVLGALLRELGLRAAVIGETHLREAQQTQLWQWLQGSVTHMGSVLVDTLAGDPLEGRRFALELEGGARLQLVMASSGLRGALSFGTQGAIHHAWDDAPLDAAVRDARARSPRWQAFSGDDGDRINPVSIHQYRRLLAGLGPILAGLPAVDDDAEVMEFLPAHAPGGIAFWQDETAAAWLRLLDEVYRAVDAGAVAIDDVLALQDVFPVFWKRIARARWFHERAWSLASRIPR